MGNSDYDSYAVVRRKWAAPRERLGQRQAILGSLRHYTTIGQRVAQCSPDYTDELPADGFEPARPAPDTPHETAGRMGQPRSSARSNDQVEQFAEKIRELGGETLAVQADVSSEVDVSRMVNTTYQTLGQIDILVNYTATILPRIIDVQDIEPDQWRRVIDMNLPGSFLCARAVLPHMIKRKTGKIINISSMGGRKGARGEGPYCASKAALINFTETLAAEAYDHGIDVNCICPGACPGRLRYQAADTAGGTLLAQIRYTSGKA